jgi:hypothetical protein
MYVGVGSCSCQRVDARLYVVPGTPHARALCCEDCLKKHGYEVPKPRTADDLDTVDGKLTWRKS